MPEPQHFDDGVGYEPTLAVGAWAIDPAPPAMYPNGAPAGPLGCFVINPADGLELEPHPEGKRNGGCCAHDGLDGTNRRCASCHAEVATLRDDCWSYVELRFEPSAVVAADVSP